MESKKPIFVDARIRRTFERRIWRPLVQPDLWKGQKLNRVFLYYGQKGSGMEEAILQLLDEHPEVKYTAVKVTKDAAEVKEAFTRLKKETVFIPLLIIRKGHFLKYHREIFLITHHLKLLPSVGFTIVLSEEVPNDEESPFWEQFGPGARIPNGLPNKDFYQSLLDWYLKDWAQCGSPASLPAPNAPHWKQFDIDTAELAVCCAYSTQSDVKRFFRRIIDYIIDQYPENRPTISMDLLKEHGMLYPFAGTSIMSISPKDGHMIQMRYDPQGITEAPSVASAESEPKKMKFSMDGEVKQEIKPI